MASVMASVKKLLTHLCLPGRYYDHTSMFVCLFVCYACSDLSKRTRTSPIFMKYGIDQGCPTFLTGGPSVQISGARLRCWRRQVGREWGGGVPLPSRLGGLGDFGGLIVAHGLYVGHYWHRRSLLTFVRSLLVQYQNCHTENLSIIIARLWF